MKNANRPCVVATLQARMSSKRLPGKVMRQIAGKPMLQHTVDRLRRCKAIDGIWIVTSTDATDDPIEAFAKRSLVNMFRGDLDDVASRILGAARAAVVRISGDSPLIDPVIVDRAVALYRREAPDLATNVLHRTFPKGQSVEVISVPALELACSEMKIELDREHVTTWFYRNPDRVRIVGFESEKRRDSYQLSVDSQQDLERAEAILKMLGEPAAEHGLEAIVAAADRVELRDQNDNE